MIKKGISTINFAMLFNNNLVHILCNLIRIEIVSFDFFYILEVANSLVNQMLVAYMALL